MTLHCLQQSPTEWLGAALQRFELQFEYPLGADSTFRISHGRDYLPFFSAMGAATLLVAEQAGEVLGTLVRVERWIQTHGPQPMRQFVHYLADLKVSPQARGGRVLSSLLLATKYQIEKTGSHSCYSIVMHGTGRLPTDYTGRLGIPNFDKIAEIMVLRISSGRPLPRTGIATAHKPACVVTGGKRELRSLMPPVSLHCGAWLEDTRRGKQLWSSSGAELLSAHLTSFRFDDPAAGAATIREALALAIQHGFNALFTAVPLSRHHALCAALPDLFIQEAPASIFGHRLSAGNDWWVDTAEI
jgi:hypothetical protein